MIIDRIIKPILFSAIICALVSPLSAQVKTIKNGIEFKNNQAKLRIIFYDDDIIRITKCTP